MSALLFSLLSIIIVPAAQDSLQDEQPLLVVSINGVVSNDAGERINESIMEIVVFYETGVVLPIGILDRYTPKTNEKGYYSAQISLYPGWKRITIAMKSHDGDLFRYPVPDAVEVTELFMNAINDESMVVQYNLVLSSRAGWQEERQKINLYGEDSDKGRLILIRGLPDKVKKFELSNNVNGELWYYYSDGIVIKFVKGIREKDFYFRPRVEK